MVSARFSQVLDDLQSRPVMPDRLPSVEPTRRILERMGIDGSEFFSKFQKDPRRIVIVAGTNGKGSVCATLEALFQSAGERVAVYTSPHLEVINERIRYRGRNISDEAFIRSYENLSKINGASGLTHFEFITLMAVDYFFFSEECKDLDRLILEVGLGGASDATNAIPHGMCVFTTIGMDHTQILGNTRPAIAAQKLGVLDGVPASVTPVVIHPKLDDEIAPVFEERRTMRSPSVWIQAPQFTSASDAEPPFSTKIFSKWGAAELKLVGTRAAWNTNVALAAFEASGYQPDMHLPSLQDVVWPGRFENLKSARLKNEVWLSGDHNPEGMASLLQIVGRTSRPLSFLVGVGFEKDLDGILGPLASVSNSKLYLTETPFRGRPLAEYGPYLDRCVKYSADWKQLLTEIDSGSTEPTTIVVTGSLYLVGAVRAWMKNLT